VTLRSANEVAEIDPSTDRVIGRYPVEGCSFDHGMAIDSEHHRAFLLCGTTHNLTVFALDNHKAIAHFPIPTGADVVKFDPGSGRVYAACSSGAISIVQEDDPNIFGRSKTFRYKSWSTALPWTPRLIACMRPNRKRMLNQSRASSSTSRETNEMKLERHNEPNGTCRPSTIAHRCQR
jgi:hypothetical protein